MTERLPPISASDDGKQEEKMARVCSVTGKRVLTGNNVSHANNKTRRRFLPNLQKASFLSETLGHRIHLRLTAHAVRTIGKNGGIDAFLVSANNHQMSSELLRVRKAILRRKSKTSQKV